MDQVDRTQPIDMPDDDGLLFGCILDGQGGASVIGWTEVEAWTDDDGPLWVHLEQDSDRVQEWLRRKSGLTPTTVDALLADETRPRVFRGKRGLAAILRGVNTNPGSEPDDLVAIRMWSDGKRVITLRHERLMTPRDIQAQLLEQESGPATAAQLYERLIGRLIDRMAGTVAAYDETLDEIEAELDIARAADTRRRLSDLRQSIVLLRRYMSPQREALNSLMVEPPIWLDEQCRIGLRETADKLLRYVEELDTARERSMVIKDDIANQLAESTNKTLYVLA
ncbi:MAG: zinc transporter ZntB, partial [Phycisphaerae bacterium]|nr:zinc transporter ZntB [Phycisphaerae bacterium]